ncbi:MAG: phospholipid carrier-dependent glycosyltransferase [Elainella sp. Prado103]|nr:phospholipid carrier-dependent glycosyltransferase [Elainella sp. Prado103]
MENEPQLRNPASDSTSNTSNTTSNTNSRIPPPTFIERRSTPTWLKCLAIGLIGFGIFVRFYQLDQKVYWIDEANSSLRTLGYTKTELIETIFTGEVVTADQLQQFQRLSPERGWDDTWNALTGTAEHTPLYFLLARAWVGSVGHSVATMRALTAILSVLVLPGMYWLCWELFRSATVGWIATALVAITPVHFLYAQEARPYSLLSIWIVLSSALLLRSMSHTGGRNWIGWWSYGLSIAAGLYTQLLFGLVVIAQGLYVWLMGWSVTEPIEHSGDPVTQPDQASHRARRTRWRHLRSYLIAAAAALLSLTPWLILLAYSWQKVQESTRSLSDNLSFNYITDRWALNLNLAFLSRELGAANLLLVLLTFGALYFLYRHAPKRAWLFVLLLVGVPFLFLALPDLALGGRRSLRIRYLFPCFLGIQIAFAYWFAMQAVWAKTWRQQLVRAIGIGLIAAGVSAGVASANAVVWWHKSLPRSSYYPPVAAIINQANQTHQPIVLSDGPVTDTLAFSAWLDPAVKLQLSLEPRQIKIDKRFDPIYLFNPTEQLQRIMTRRGYQLTVIYEDRADPTEVENRLWLAQRP